MGAVTPPSASPPPSNCPPSPPLRSPSSSAFLSRQLPLASSLSVQAVIVARFRPDTVPP